jgi:hypothetical protein
MPSYLFMKCHVLSRRRVAYYVNFIDLNWKKKWYILNRRREKIERKTSDERCNELIYYRCDRSSCYFISFLFYCTLLRLCLSFNSSYIDLFASRMMFSTQNNFPLSSHIILFAPMVNEKLKLNHLLS